MQGLKTRETGNAATSRPLGAYATLVAAFGATFATFVLLARIFNRPLPRQVPITDLLLVGLASRQAGRVLSQDPVTSFLRAPFTVRVETAGSKGVEQPRGDGLRRAVGELLTNPRSTSQWAAAGFIYGLVLAPRLTRVVAAIFASASIADLLRRTGTTSQR